MFTITTISGFLGEAKVNRLADAALLKLAWETNQPWSKGDVVVFDPDNYLIPSVELAKGLAIKKNELETDLAYYK